MPSTSEATVDEPVVCARCEKNMTLSVIKPDLTGSEVRIYECFKCGATRTEEAGFTQT